MKNRLERMASRIARGRKAETSLEDQIIVQAFEEVEKGILNAWQEADPFDEKLLTLLKMKQEALKGVKEKLAFYVNQGKAAKTELEKEKTK